MAITKATITYAPNFNDEANPVVQYSNPAGKTVTSLKIAILTGDGNETALAEYRDLKPLKTSYTFEFTDAERTLMRKYCYNATSAPVIFRIKTVINGTTYYSSKNKTLKIIKCQPDINPELYDTNEKTVALTGDNSIIVKYYSNMYYNFNEELKKNAMVAIRRIECGSKSSPASEGTLEAVENGDFEFYLRDSRGNEVSAIGSRMTVNYIPPTCNISSSISLQENSNYGKITGEVTGKFFNGNFGAVTNLLKVQYRYKTVEGSFSNWTTISATTNGNKYTAEINITDLDYEETYIVQARIQDELLAQYEEYVTSKKSTLKYTPIFDWGENDFNFNVPVNFNDSITANNTSINLSGLVKALTNSYTLTAKVTWTNTDYSASSVSAVLIGNELRIGFSATRSTSTGTGNIDNEIICSIEVTHNGKITKAFDVSFASGGTGAVSTFNAASVTVADTYLTFDIQLNATTIATKNFGSYFTIPVALNLNAY